MALIFQRLAHNFIKNGYYPTDSTTVSGILSALDIGGKTMRILDPCCGEGCALAELRHHLTGCGADVASYGIEFDKERAWHAKQILDRVVHSDVHDVVVSPRSVGLLFLNPPYGDVVSDTAQTGDKTKHDRLEKVFFRKTIGTLQYGGVMVLIVPTYVIDADFASMISRHCNRVTMFKAPETRFKQSVIFGIKKRADHPTKAITDMLVAMASGDMPCETLPEHWIAEPYLVPQSNEEAEFRFNAVRIDGVQLQAELDRYRKQTLWPQFDGYFSQGVRQHRQPLRDMSKWHLALALAAGQACGMVHSKDGRSLLIKGDTFKEKDRKVECAISDDGKVTETVTMTDKFVPVIKGIEFTPDERLGQIVTIR